MRGVGAEPLWPGTRFNECPLSVPPGLVVLVTVCGLGEPPVNGKEPSLTTNKPATAAIAVSSAAMGPKRRWQRCKERPEGPPRLIVHVRPVRPPNPVRKASMANWSDWLPFPDPRKGQFLNAPFGAGVYQIRNRVTGEMILFGIGGHCAHRMSSLLPKPLGRGTRSNSQKRQYVLDHLVDMEYRCLACQSRANAVTIEQQIRVECDYKFAT